MLPVHPFRNAVLIVVLLMSPYLASAAPAPLPRRDKCPCPDARVALGDWNVTPDDYRSNWFGEPITGTRAGKCDVELTRLEKKEWGASNYTTIRVVLLSGAGKLVKVLPNVDNPQASGTGTWTSEVDQELGFVIKVKFKFKYTTDPDELYTHSILTLTVPAKDETSSDEISNVDANTDTEETAPAESETLPDNEPFEQCASESDIVDSRTTDSNTGE